MASDEMTALMAADFDDVWRFVRRRTLSRADADDATAEVFAVAWRRYDQRPVLADEQRMWLFGIARRVLANQYRSSRRRQQLHLRLVERAPEAATVDEDRDPALWRALASLRPEDRELLMMRAWDNLPVTDIAVLLDCSANAVSVRLTKARGRLAKALEIAGDSSTESSERNVDRKWTDSGRVGHTTSNSPEKEDRNG